MAVLKRENSNNKHSGLKAQSLPQRSSTIELADLPEKEDLLKAD